MNRPEFLVDKKNTLDLINSLKINQKLEFKEKELLVLYGATENYDDKIYKDFRTLYQELHERNRLEMIGSLEQAGMMKYSVKFGHLNVSDKFEVKISREVFDRNFEDIRDGNCFGVITLEKDIDEKVLFISDFRRIEASPKNLLSDLIDYRKKIGVEEWHKLILATLGYNLGESNGITKYLLLMRLLPYTERRLNYIELGGYSTGKSTFGEKFSNSISLNPSISQSQFIANIKSGEEGIVYKKDVLYFDESDLKHINLDIFNAILQGAAGNTIASRDSKFSKNTDASFILQSNLHEAEKRFTERRLLEAVKDDKRNIGAALDRFSYLLPGWSIPNYERVKLKDGDVGIRQDVFEELLKSLRNETGENYSITGLNVEVIENNSTGRFKEGIVKAFTGFFKILFLDCSVQEIMNSDKLYDVIYLSCLGKYLLYEAGLDAGLEVFKNNGIKITLNGATKRFGRKELFGNYVSAKEKELFIENPSFTNYENLNKGPSWAEKKIVKQEEKWEKNTSDKLKDFHFEVKNEYLPEHLREACKLFDEKTRKKAYEAYRKLKVYNEKYLEDSEVKKHVIKDLEYLLKISIAIAKQGNREEDFSFFSDFCIKYKVKRKNRSLSDTLGDDIHPDVKELYKEMLFYKR